MSTSDPSGLAGGDADVLRRQIENLANEYFTGGPAAAPSAVAMPTAPSAAGVSAPSMTQSGPPVPGAMHTPPLAATPMPKEADLRNAPALFAEPLGTTPLAIHSGLADRGEVGGVPYFLGLANAAPMTAAPMNVQSAPMGGSVPSAHSPTQPPPEGEGLFGGAAHHLPLQEQTMRAPTHNANAAPLTSSPSPSGGGWVGESNVRESNVRESNVRESNVRESDARESNPLPTSAYSFSPELSSLDAKSIPRHGASRPLEPNVVKRDFPILRERVHGKPLIWLDSAATTQKPQSVIDRISYFYEHENSNVHRAAHAMAARATDAYEAARDKVRGFLGAPSAQNIVFVRGATEGINLVAQSWGRRNISAGDEIVITHLEHHANIVPWQQLCSERGAKLRVAPVDSRGDVILEEYEKLLGPKTRLVAITQVSNALGTIVPVREMTQMAQRHGARVLIDGAQAVSHMPVDVQALGCDFYVFSGHKVFAPTGIGALFGKADVLEAMPPWQGGGNMIADVTFERTIYQAPPYRFEAGTGNIADAVGLGAAIDYVTELGMENIQRYEHELLHYAEGRLATVPGLQMIAAPREKAGVLSFVLDGQRSEDVGSALDQDGIAVRSGHHCAQPILRRFGHESTVRASLAPYNTPEDIDALVRTLLKLQAGRPPRV